MTSYCISQYLLFLCLDQHDSIIGFTKVITRVSNSEAVEYNIIQVRVWEVCLPVVSGIQK